jgi:Rrf2 family protein|tara:strand:- start:78 stop:479 length:402 start_codon:yes stop_codon:yes gene_type:complete
MLKLTRKLEYALIALRHIQGQATEKIVSTKEIAETHRIPLQLLAKTLQQLAKHNIIEAIQGAHGGYRLKKSLDNINMNTLIQILEGPIGIMDCSVDSNCVQLDICNIRKPINRVNDAIVSMFDNLTLADITRH